LTRNIGVNHRLRHEADDLHNVRAGGIIALVVLDEVRGRLKNSVESLALGDVFGGGEWLTVAFDEPGYVALAGFDNKTSSVGMGIDFTDAIA